MTTGHAINFEHRYDDNTMERSETSQLALNEIGSVNFEVAEALHFDAYDENKSSGAFIIIDRLSNLTVGAGMITGAFDGENKQTFSAFELEFNTLVRKHFPHWGARDILKG